MVDRFLATCEQCGAWYTLEVNSGASGKILVRLPEPAAILDALAAQKGPGQVDKRLDQAP